jgi:GntR family L-lactate dehydrogenase operon transcriptional regulator
MMGAVACQLATRIESDEGEVLRTAETVEVGHGLTATSPQFEHTVLHLLEATEGPAGSGTLMERLDDLGFRVSEPTVGRFLRVLDRRGLTERVSNKGRGLTEAGRERLTELCEAESQVHYGRELLRSIRTTTVEEIVEVLIARRALERETARLAAERATDEDIARLEEAVRQQRAALDSGRVAAEADVRFHALVAQASRNRVLAAAIALIRRDRQITMTLDAMLRRTTHRYAVGHEGIVAAIRRRDPRAAERAMLGHIDTVIADVRAYAEQSDGTALPTA